MSVLSCCALVTANTLSHHCQVVEALRWVTRWSLGGAIHRLATVATFPTHGYLNNLVPAEKRSHHCQVVEALRWVTRWYSGGAIHRLATVATFPIHGYLNNLVPAEKRSHHCQVVVGKVCESMVTGFDKARYAMMGYLGFHCLQPYKSIA